MRRGGAWLATLALAIAAPGAVMAQSPGAVIAPGTAPPAGEVFTVGVVLDPGPAVTLGYLHRVGGAPGAAGDRGRSGTYVGARLKLPTTVWRNEAWRLDLSSATTIGGAHPWAVPVSGAVYLAHGRNRAGTMLGVGTELRAAPGRYGLHGSLALDLGWQVAWRTRIHHSAESRDAFGERYPDDGGESAGVAGPRDGWYGWTANRWRLGVAGSRAVGSRTVLQFAAGALVARQRQGVVLGFDLAQLPFYLELGAVRDW